MGTLSTPVQVALSDEYSGFVHGRDYTLPPPVSLKRIKAAEAAFGFPMHSDLRDLLLCHDGLTARPVGGGRKSILYGALMLPNLQEVRDLNWIKSTFGLPHGSRDGFPEGFYVPLKVLPISMEYALVDCVTGQLICIDFSGDGQVENGFAAPSLSAGFERAVTLLRSWQKHKDRKRVYAELHEGFLSIHGGDRAFTAAEQRFLDSFRPHYERVTGQPFGR